MVTSTNKKEFNLNTQVKTNYDGIKIPRNPQVNLHETPSGYTWLALALDSVEDDLPLRQIIPLRNLHGAEALSVIPNYAGRTLKFAGKHIMHGNDEKIIATCDLYYIE